MGQDLAVENRMHNTRTLPFKFYLQKRRSRWIREMKFNKQKKCRGSSTDQPNRHLPGSFSIKEGCEGEQGNSPAELHNELQPTMKSHT